MFFIHFTIYNKICMLLPGENVQIVLDKLDHQLIHEMYNSFHSKAHMMLSYGPYDKTT